MTGWGQIRKSSSRAYRGASPPQSGHAARWHQVRDAPGAAMSCTATRRFAALPPPLIGTCATKGLLCPMFGVSEIMVSRCASILSYRAASCSFRQARLRDRIFNVQSSRPCARPSTGDRTTTASIANPRDWARTSAMPRNRTCAADFSFEWRENRPSNRGLHRMKFLVSLRIWGSGVRISSGAPLRYKTGNAKTRRSCA